ncbi:unnamed protein product [Gadus morhua 'NCC']
MSCTFTGSSDLLVLRFSSACFLLGGWDPKQSSATAQRSLRTPVGRRPSLYVRTEPFTGGPRLCSLTWRVSANSAALL